MDDSLRRRIKQLAAILDTSQGEVVARGVDLLEKTLQKQPDHNEHPARKIMKEAADQRKEITWRQSIREKLREPGLPIDEIIISNWSDFVED